MTSIAERLRAAFGARDASTRLQVAMAAGTRPRDEQIDVLVDRCAVEPDFGVREALTWALVRHDADLTLPRLLAETRGAGAQARSQALHTLSKIGDPRGWAAIEPHLLADADEQTARTAWRAAVVLAPDDARPELAARLVQQLGRGDRELQRSLTRSLVELGATAAAALEAVCASGAPAVRQHAIATRRIIDDPDEGFDAAMFEAERTIAGLGAQPPDAPA